MGQVRYLQMDPVKDHETIVRWMVVDTWKFDLVRATEIALLKTFAFPEIACILVNSGEFMGRTQKRYDDTELLLALFIENGYSSPTGMKAIQKINRMHARHPITQDQLLYVLSTFVVEPIHWINRYGWRALNDVEKQALFHFWIEVGRRMGIKELFPSLDAMLLYHERYESEKMIYSQDNALLYHGVLPTVARMMPFTLGTLKAWALPAIMPPRMCAAFGFPPRLGWERALVTFALRCRSLKDRFVPSKPVFRSQIHHPTYPHGFRFEDLGTKSRNHDTKMVPFPSESVQKPR
ncbi:MAG: oxygenase MpaB family protein [Oligoflexus sp.]